MTLDEAIKRYTDNAEYERTHGNLQGCLDFRQLAEWLSELTQLKEQTRWIPVSERNPKERDWYIVTEGTTRTTFFRYYSVLNGWEHGHDVVAWMPLPEPYGEESEVTQDADSN